MSQSIRLIPSQILTWDVWNNILGSSHCEIYSINWRNMRCLKVWVCFITLSNEMLGLWMIRQYVSFFDGNRIGRFCNREFRENLLRSHKQPTHCPSLDKWSSKLRLSTITFEGGANKSKLQKSKNRGANHGLSLKGDTFCNSLKSKVSQNESVCKRKISFS